MPAATSPLPSSTRAVRPRRQSWPGHTRPIQIAIRPVTNDTTTTPRPISPDAPPFSKTRKRATDIAIPIEAADHSPVRKSRPVR